MSIGVVVFPGSNCDRDVHWAAQGCLNIPTRFLWHETRDLNGLDAVVLPGGFSMATTSVVVQLPVLHRCLSRWWNLLHVAAGCSASAMAFRF